MTHTSVLLHTAVDGLAIAHKTDPIIVDGTFGAGGHTKEICRRNRGAYVIAVDRDREAIEQGEKLSFDCSVELVNRNIRNIDHVLDELGIKAVDAILLDLGFSSTQLERSGRGFSFQKDEPLLMTLGDPDGAASFTARDIVNDFSEDQIDRIIRGYGEEHRSQKIARAIVESRKRKPIETTEDLVRIIENTVPRRGKIHPATKTFQALRIAVNDEIESLEDAIEKGFGRLKSGGRFAIISFHSLEDRTVKRAFLKKAHEKRAQLITKKPIRPSSEEVAQNPRARSAKLRILERI